MAGSKLLNVEDIRKDAVVGQKISAFNLGKKCFKAVRNGNNNNGGRKYGGWSC